MTIKFQQEKERFTALQKIHKDSSKNLHDKLTGMMIGRCYKTITLSTANEFLRIIMQNRTDIDVSSYVPLNFKYFEDPGANFELTKDEILTIKLLKQVWIIIQSSPWKM